MSFVFYVLIYLVWGIFRLGCAHKWYIGNFRLVTVLNDETISENAQVNCRQFAHQMEPIRSKTT